VRISFSYPGVPALDVADSSLVALLEPRARPPRSESEADLIRRGLENPIGAPRLREVARGKRAVLVLVDDYTRNTPVHRLLPPVLEELAAAGVPAPQVRLLVASGTHRRMTDEEKRKRFGAEVTAAHAVLDHRHDDPSQLARLPTTEHGTEVWVNRALLESDLVLGIGHIVPHRVAGFSGGGKIVVPGVGGSITIGQTHWLSAQFEGAEIMGKVDNPVRREIESAAKAAGLRWVVNAVLDAAGALETVVCGDPEEAFRAGARTAVEIYGVPLAEPADIVIAESFPADMEMWQAAKGVYSADLALKRGGVLVLVSPCPEGVSAEFPEIPEIGYRPFGEVKALVESGALRDLTLAAHLVHGGRVIADKGTGILVSMGIDAETASRLGFRYAATPQRALELALELKGSSATVAVLRHGGEIMPVLGGHAW
jgi:lactate racemase